jgi:hypothetical protein
MPGKPTDYSSWARMLCGHFFVSANEGRGVTFFVDDDVLDRLAPGPKGSAATSLARVVKNRLLSEASGRMFEPVVSETTSWKYQGAVGDNPSIPLLACAVLAATRMASEGAIGSNNYYRRFRSLLGLSGIGMPANYDTAYRVLWSVYTWWLDTHLRGSLGRSTVQSHPQLTNIFFSISQALLRNADRKRFTEFFEWIGWEPGDPITDAEIRACLPAWVEHNQGLGTGVKLMLRHDQYQPLLIAAVRSEFANWRGRVEDEGGVEVARIVLALDLFPKPRLWLSAAQPVSWPQSIKWSWKGFTGQASSQNGWYGELGLQPSSELLLTGATLTSTAGSLRLDGRPALPMRIDQGVGWTSVTRTVLFEKHYVLFHSSVATEVREFIGRYAILGWDTYDRSGVLPLGWAALKDVEFHTVPPAPIDLRIASLVPAHQVRPLIVGGLKLGPAGLYLTGGEPDVVLPLPPTEGLSVMIDGNVRPYPPEGGTIKLRDSHLSAGSHEIAAGFASFIVRTVQSMGRGPSSAVGGLGHSLIPMPDGYYPTAATARALDPAAGPSVTVVGALVTAPAGSLSDPEPLILRRGEDEILLAGRSPGEVYRPSIPPEPLLSRIVPGLLTNRFEAEQPPFEVVWILWRSGTTWHAVARVYKTPRNTREPNLESGIAVWASAFSREVQVQGVLALPLWPQYREVAARLL